MPARALADTGALLAYLDRSDRWHARCREAFGLLRLPLLTSEAVLTELFHLLGDEARDVRAAWSFVQSGALSVAPLTDADLPDLEALMRRYHDRPMDFADATLVRIAEREAILTVFTVDHDDFQTYRIGGRQRFRVLPTPEPPRKRSAARRVSAAPPPLRRAGAPAKAAGSRRGGHAPRRSGGARLGC